MSDEIHMTQTMYIPVLCPYRLSDDDLIDVVKLIPIVVLCQRVFHQGLKLWTSRNSDVQRLGGEEGLEVEKIEIIVVNQIGHELVGHPVEAGELREGHVPLPVRRTIHTHTVCQWLGVIEPLLYGAVLLIIHLYLDCLQGLHI